jgi:hypothetical protein
MVGKEKFINCICPAAQNVEQFLFGAEIWIVNEGFDEPQIGHIILSIQIFKCDYPAPGFYQGALYGVKCLSPKDGKYVV